MGSTLGWLAVKLTGDDSELLKTLNSTENNLKKLTKTIAPIGREIYNNLTLPFINFGKEALSEFTTSEDAAKKLEVVLRGLGGSTKLTKDKMIELATGLSKLTTYTDEAIMGAESMLIPFRTISEDLFPKVLETTIDIADMFGKDLNNAALQLGKALESPIEGMSGLRRVGIVFNDEQEKVIKNLVETGRVADAQKIIIDELQNKFGGLAKEVGTTTSGKLKLLTKNIDELKESFGKIIAEVMTPIIGILKDIVGWFGALDETTKKGILTAIALAGAFGLIYKGVTTALTIFKTFNAVMSTAFGPAGLIIAGATALYALMTAMDAATGATKRHEESQKMLLAIQKEQKQRIDENISGFQKQIDAMYKVNNASREQIELALKDQYMLAMKNEDKKKMIEIEKQINDLRKKWADEDKLRDDEKKKRDEESKKLQDENWKIEEEKRKERLAKEAEDREKRAKDSLEEVDYNISLKEKQNEEEKKQLEEMDKAIESYWKKQKEDEERFYKSLGETASMAYNGIKDVVLEINSRIKESELETLEETTNEKLKALEIEKEEKLKNTKDKIGIEQFYDNEKKKIEEEEKLRKREILKKAAEAEKAFSIFDIIIKTSQAIMNAWTAPFPFSAIQVGLATASGIAQLALVQSQPVPSFKKGGQFIVPSGFEDDNFPMRVSSGERVTVEPKGGGFGGQRITIYLGSKILYDDIVKAMENNEIRVPTSALVGV